MIKTKKICVKGDAFLPLQPVGFDPRQEMGQPDFELQYKRDSYLKDVELHHHDFFEIYFLLSGDVTYLIESRICRVMPGDLLLISPRELHQVCIVPEMAAYERYVLWVDPQLIQKLSTQGCDLMQGLDPNRPGYFNQLRLSGQDRSLIQQLLDTLYREAKSDGYGADLLRQSLLTQLLVTINRLVAQQGSHYEEDKRTSQAVRQVVSYINLHYAEPLSLDLLAEKVFVSKYHLSHEFTRQMGTGIYRFIQKKRLMIARQLLMQGSKPNDVYTACGFGDYAGFYRAFKGEYGVSPREFANASRQRNQETERIS